MEASKKKNKWVFAVLFTALFALYGICHNKIPIYSDTTTILPMSEDILSGNIFLRGWILGTNNFYFTETVPYALGLALGFSPAALLQWFPGVAWAFLAVLGLYLLSPEQQSRKEAVFFALLSASVLWFVPQCAGYTVLNANTHNNLYAFLGLYLFLLRAYLQKQSRHALIWATILGGMLSFSEGVTTMVLIVPLAALSLFCCLFEQKKEYIPVLISVVLSYGIGRLLFGLFAAVGGMETVGFPIGLTPVAELPKRILPWLNQLGILYGCDNLTSGRFSPDALYVSLWIAALFFTLFRELFRLRSLSDSEKCLLFIAGVNAACCLFTDVPVYHRYCVPAYYCGTLLLLCRLQKLLPQIKNLTLARTLAVLFSLLSFFALGQKTLGYVRTEDYGAEQKALAQYIKNEQLGNGYADYWCASAISYYGDYDIQILPVWINTDNEKIREYSELVQRSWYQMDDVHYIISYAEAGESIFVDETRMYEICGQPDRIEQIGEYALYIWDEDISEYMSNGLFDGIYLCREMVCNENGQIGEEELILYPGGISYGPYSAMTRGSYRITIEGRGLEHLDYDVNSNAFGLLDTTLLYRDSNTICFTCTLPRKISDLEIRCFNQSTETAALYQIEMERSGIGREKEDRA